MYKIWIVEDDATIAGQLKKHFISWGMEARCAADFRNIIGEFVEYAPHLVLMDITLPFFNGYHWCGELRKLSQVPIIFLSSASDNLNIVMAMNLGGDDFITKPFDLNVLQAKVQAMLRRTYDFTAQGEFLEHRGVVLNLSDMTAAYQGQVFELTKNEYRILQVLLENKGKTVHRDTLMKRLWETDCFVDENTLTVNIARLRKKLSEHGIEEMILTRKGVGYVVQ